MLRRKFDPGKKETAQVLSATMAYLDHGRGDHVVLLHGNPTPSYLWRKVILGLSDLGRCIAPDLVGMGDSARIAEGRHAYRFSMHAEYLKALLEPGESRRPTLTWPREIAIHGEPQFMVDVVEANEQWLSGAEVSRVRAWPA